MMGSLIIIKQSNYKYDEKGEWIEVIDGKFDKYIAY